MIRHNGIAIDTRRMCVEHRGITVYFTPQVFRLMHALLLAGPKTTRELAVIVYRDNDDGGPVTWNNCIAAQIWTRNDGADPGCDIRAGPDWNRGDGFPISRSKCHLAPGIATPSAQFRSAP